MKNRIIALVVGLLAIAGLNAPSASAAYLGTVSLFADINYGGGSVVNLGIPGNCTKTGFFWAPIPPAVWTRASSLSIYASNPAAIKYCNIVGVRNKSGAILWNCVNKNHRGISSFQPLSVYNDQATAVILKYQGSTLCPLYDLSRSY